MSDMTDASGQMPRRGPRGGDGGAPVSGAVAIVLALVAVVVGFLILNSISNGGEDALDFPVDTASGADDGADTAVTETTVDPSQTTVGSLAPVDTTPTIQTEGASVIVANANGVGGSAGSMKRALETGPGFTVVDAVNASAAVGDIDETVIYYNAENPNAQPVAESLGLVLGGVANISPLTGTPPTADGDMQGADVLLMLGNDKAGKTLAELNPELAAEATTQVTNPPIAGTGTTTVPG
jgi:hypothetical protein